MKNVTSLQTLIKQRNELIDGVTAEIYQHCQAAGIPASEHDVWLYGTTLDGGYTFHINTTNGHVYAAVWHPGEDTAGLDWQLKHGDVPKWARPGQDIDAATAAKGDEG